jgi:Domain of unknown function (DUF4386)
MVTSIQKNAARIAGFMYLLLSVLAFTAAFGIRSHILAGDDYSLISARILHAEILFRIGMVCDLVGGTGNALLAIALYTLLKPVNEYLSLLAAFWRLGETVILGYIVYHSMEVLQLLKDPGYSAVFTRGQLQGLIRSHFDAQGAGFNIGLFFYSLGSTLFCYLLFKSRFIPRGLSLWGLLGSLLAGLCIMATTIFPPLETILIPAGYIPVGVFEVVAGFWLLFLPIRQPKSLS